MITSPKTPLERLRCGAASLFLFLFLTQFAVAYQVIIEGVEDPSLAELIHAVSDLEKLKNRPPGSVLALKRRIERDLKNIRKALDSRAYYGANLSFTVEEKGDRVRLHVTLGPSYPLRAFRIRYFHEGKEWDPDTTPPDSFTPPTLGALRLELGALATPETILRAEDLLLDALNLQGYPFATILKRDVFLDQEAHDVLVWMMVETGPLARFGSVRIEGNERTRRTFFEKKLRWHEGDIYSPLAIEKTQEALELSGLFKSVSLNYDSQLSTQGTLPLTISVMEAKQRTIGFGVNYMTSLGPGLTGEWEDRNSRGLGERFGLKASLWVKKQEGTLAYRIPDFLKEHQNLILYSSFRHEQTKAFTQHTLSVGGTIDRKINRFLQFSYGTLFKLLHSQHSEQNGVFDLVEFPLEARWNRTNNLLDPTRGETLLLKVVPSFQVRSPNFFYTVSSITGTYHVPLTQDETHVLATKMILGSIVGASKNEIPPPERFYGGSESTFRGYRYLTVSPLGRHDKVLGGRSLFLISAEWRMRLKENLGMVLFYDGGNVYHGPVPFSEHRFLQSTGLGIRYYTPVGPLRLDFAFPLNPRKIDHRLEVYFSIGQAF